MLFGFEVTYPHGGSDYVIISGADAIDAETNLVSMFGDTEIGVELFDSVEQMVDERYEGFAVLSTETGA